MNLNSVRRLINGANTMLKQYSPQILTGVGAAGVVTTAVLTHRGTVLAIDAWGNNPDNLGIDYKDVKITESLEHLRQGWKFYIPAFLSGAASIAAIIAGNTIALKRQAAIAAAYTLSREAYSAYKDEVKALVGEEKAKKAETKAEERVAKEHSEDSTQVIIASDNEVLCYDGYSGRYFKQTLEGLRKIENDINYDLINFDGASLNEYYQGVGLAQTDIGDTLGWKPGTKLEFTFDSVLLDGGRPALFVKITPEPEPDWFKLGS